MDEADSWEAEGARTPPERKRETEREGEPLSNRKSREYIHISCEILVSGTRANSGDFFICWCEESEEESEKCETSARRDETRG